MDTDKISNFSYINKIKFVKQILHAILLVSLIIGINAISAQYFKRIDITKNGLYSLSAETKAHLRTLDQPTKIIVLIPKDSNQPELEQIHSHVGRLLRSYEAESIQNGNRLLSIEYVDPFRQRSKVQSIYDKFKIDEENIILVVQEDRVQIVRQADLYSVKNNEILGFKGENAITSGIINVNSKTIQNIYFLVGHGEKDIDDNDPKNGLSYLKTFLENKNFKTHRLNLYQNPNIPKDSSLILIVAPQGKIEDFEVELLRRYMTDRNGRIIALIDPGRIHGLDELFFDWGIIADNKFIFGSEQSFLSNSDDFIINQFADHPINNLMLDYNLNAIFGQPRPVKMDPLASNNSRLSVTEIIATGNTTWIENSYTDETPISYNPETDIQGPISIATISNLSHTSSLGIDIPTGRMAVFGSSTFIANNHFQIFGNQILFYNTVNWILDRMHFLNIPVKPINSYQITMNKKESQSLLVYYSILPIFIALWGSLILYLRKR
ncbi:MAG: GldG family protein [Coraliomargaritaceae bacterium]